jgi:transcriptional regulator GlxA family with amidase domain
MINFGALSVFELANAKSGKPEYDLVVMSERGGSVRNSFGMEISTNPLYGGSFDTILMGSSSEPRSAAPRLISYLRAASETTRRLVSICVGAFTFGEAGLLRNRRATTHWAYSADLQRRFPDTKVETDRIFLADGQIWTSGGMTACIDLALEMVERDLGQDLARAVARSMVLCDRRAGGQSQHSALLDVAARSDRVQKALAFARQHLAAALAAAALRPDMVGAVVSRGGRPDLAGASSLTHVRAPTLLIVGGNDTQVATTLRSSSSTGRRMRSCAAKSNL